MNPRITISSETVKAVSERLTGAYQRGDTRLVRRVSALLEVLVGGQSVVTVSQKWGISPGCVYEWIKELIWKGIAGLTYQRRGGRRPKLTPSQKKQLCTWLDGSPQAQGFTNGCWSSLLVQELIRREFGGMVYNRTYVCELLKQMGYTFQKPSSCRITWMRPRARRGNARNGRVS